MTRLFPTATAALVLAVSLPAAALDGVNTSARLSCNVSGMYADGTRIAGNGSEELSIDIRRGASGNATSDIRVTSNGRTREAALLRSTSERLAFAYASDALVDGMGQTLAITYEIRLDSLRLKRTVMALFAGQGSTLQSAETNCVLAGSSPAAAGAMPSGPAPDWLVEFRRKLKECGTKDPVSEMTCIERMKARYCTNRPAGIPECENK
jgi:hypothetical protein